jgi:hypothetical protein
MISLNILMIELIYQASSAAGMAENRFPVILHAMSLPSESQPAILT